MKRYIIICVNEERQVVSCNAYKTIEQASTKMMAEYYTELHDKLEIYCGNERCISSNIDMDNNIAYVSYNEFGYFWEIKTVEIPE